MTGPRRVHVVYEHTPDHRPYSTAAVRLLRPLSHPRARARVAARFGLDYLGTPVDAVIVDRLWHDWASPATVERLIARIRAAGAWLIHALDDNLPDLAHERPDWGNASTRAVLDLLLAAADGFLVSTAPLAERMRAFGRPVACVPNALDERLLDPRRVDPAMRAALAPRVRRPSPETLVIGYMGTFTHAGDLDLVLPALRAVCARHVGRVQLQLVGVLEPGPVPTELEGLPLEIIAPEPAWTTYTTFLPWLVNALDWDLAIAPLVDTPFTRGKSDIKLLDYAAMGVPGIFSRVPAYAATVRHGETGWLVDNRPDAWEEALESLIADAALRRRLAEGARAYLHAERTLAHTAERWPEAIEGLIEARAEGQGSRTHLGSAGVPPADRVETPQVDILYEYGADSMPLAHSEMRLIRPFRHPAAGGGLDLRWSTDFDRQPIDAVLLDRLWRPDVDGRAIDALLEGLRAMGVRLLYAIDDNLLDLPAERPDWPSPAQVALVERLLGEADGVIVASPALAARLASHNPRIVVLPNALDERLLGPARPPARATPFGERPLVIGYMGTPTHDDDLRLVLPALRAVCARRAGRVVVELLGGAARPSTWRQMADLPLRTLRPHPTESAYPLFMQWYSHRVQWDIGLAPLLDTPFRRCKSDVKHLDIAAIGAAGIYSRVEAYAGTVRHGETGLLVENTRAAWEEALERLLADDDLRSHIATEARRYLHAERVLAVRAPDWPAALRRLLADDGRASDEGSASVESTLAGPAIRI